MKNYVKLILSIALVFAAAFTVHAIAGTAGVMLAGVTPVALPLKNQLAEKELIKKFRHDNTWLSAIRSKNNWVNNDVIKIPKRGAAPDVLINNSIYPITSSGRDDSHVTLSLNKYETKNTTVTDDELYALPYEKVSDVQVQHREELEDTTAEHALHSISPTTNTAKTPVLETTGDNDGTGRLQLTTSDLIRLKKKLDKLNVPKMGRVLVLCPDHVGDLLNEDRKFYAQYQNIKAGQISSNYCGFEVYEANYTPTYATGSKEAFGATATGEQASIVFHKRTTNKATGTVKRYALNAANNPHDRENIMGFRLWFICISIKDEGSAAIVSGTA